MVSTKKLSFIKRIESDISVAIDFAKNNKLKRSEISDGLYFAFANNQPELWKAIADNHKISKTQLLSMMEENDGEMLYPAMVRLWLACKPSQDLKDECLYCVSDGLDLKSIPCINTKEIAHELLTMLIEAGASEMAVLPYLLKNNLNDLADKLYSTQKHQTWLQSIIGSDEQTDAWLLAKSTDLKSAQGSALLNALIENDKQEAFDKFLPLVDVTISFSKYESLLETALLRHDDDYYFEQLLAYGATLPAHARTHSILWRAVCNPRNPKRLKSLLEMGIDPNTIPYDGANPVLWIAVSRNDIEIVNLLFEYGAHAYIPRNKAMFIARKQGNTEMEQLLLDHGAPPLSEPDPYKPVFTMPKYTNDMETLWRAWLLFYDKHNNAHPQQPIKGASEERIQKLEEHIGYKLPDEIKTIYRLSEGGRHLFFGTTLLTPEEVMEQWRNKDEDGYYDKLDDLKVTIYPEDSIRFYSKDKQGNFKPKAHIWLVGGKEYENEGALYLDLTPGKTGTYGQIIHINWNFDNKTTVCCRLAGSITELVAKLLQHIANGEFVLSPDYLGIIFDNEADFDPKTGKGRHARTVLPWLQEKLLE